MDTKENIGGHDHWQKIYTTKNEDELSWFQEYPTVSMKLIHSLSMDLNSKIIDVGSGDGRFIEALLEKGYRDITALDISEAAIKRAKKRLAEKSGLVKWIASDILNFEPLSKYHLWHDRATFHFLINEEEINRYVSIAEQGIIPKGYLIMSTFSEKGPKKCSGLEITQYSESSLTAKLERGFEKLNCINQEHVTAGGNVHNFLFCCFKKK
jgi:2-polyprenyl-3-methyl-5-hydroxy-6-metoxy-1,4-benzoquinol methylase